MASKSRCDWAVNLYGDIAYFDGIEIEIKEVLNTMSLFLGMEIPNWPPDNIAEMSKKLEENNY